MRWTRVQRGLRVRLLHIELVRLKIKKILSFGQVLMFTRSTMAFILCKNKKAKRLRLSSHKRRISGITKNLYWIKTTEQCMNSLDGKLKENVGMKKK
jgi:hypothetical protein